MKIIIKKIEEIKNAHNKQVDYIKERHNKRFNELKEKYELLQNNSNSLEIQVNTLSEKYQINSREMAHLKMNSQKEIDGLKIN